jgi:cell division protein ZapA (FtsZ GTPase activity inhibitor)
MGELLSVKVSIANRNYPLRVTKEEQEKVLRAAENINKRIKEFEDNYSVKDKQDLLAMCALQFASEAMGAKQNTAEQTTKEVQESISYLNMLIDEYVEKENSSHLG